MHTQIRLAERQGLLRGEQLSLVQVQALMLLDQIERHEEHKQLDRQLRRDVGEFGWEKFSSLFAEYLPPEPEEIGVDEALDSEDAVRYDFSQAQIDPEEAERLLASLMAEAQVGSVSGETVYGDWV